MRRPTLRFTISPDRDTETFFAFAKDAEFDGGENLEWAIWKKFPELKGVLKPPYDRGAVAAFVEKQYAERKAAIAGGMEKVQADWSEMETRFDALVSQLFRDEAWPAGEYVCYPTIWGMFPRFLETKTFQVPYQHKMPGYISVVIAHELLHFKFYDFFKKAHPEYPKPENDFFVWRLSEIFNSVVQNSPEWLAVFGVENMIYPDMAKDIETVRGKVRGKTLTADSVTSAIISVLKK